jgi:hypothetical protein
MKVLVCIFLCTALSFTAIAVGKWGKIQQLLDQKEYTKAYYKIASALKKNPQDAGYAYLYAVYFTANENPAYQLDSAYKYAQAAQAFFQNATPKQQEKWKKDKIDKTALTQLVKKVEESAFLQAQKSNEIITWEHFIKNYPNANQKNVAIDSLHSLAFQKANEVGTYQSFELFLQKYPDAPQAKIAQEKYEKLLYQSYENKNQIKSWEEFVAKYPENAYYEEAVKKIYIWQTVFHTPKNYELFLQKYSHTVAGIEAKAWLDVFQGESQPPMVLLPMVENEQIGWCNEKGEIVIPARYDSMPDNYRCEGLLESVIILYKNQKAGAVNRQNRCVIPFDFEEVNYFCEGLLRVKKNKQYGLWHYGGFEVLPTQFESIEKLPNSPLIQTVKNNKIQLFSMQGAAIATPPLDDVQTIGNFVVLLQKGKYAITTPEILLQTLRNETLEWSFQYDEVQTIKNDRFLLVRKENSIGLLNEKLHFAIPLQMQAITSSNWGFVVKQQQQYQIYQNTGKPIAGQQNYQAVRFNNYFYLLQQNSKWAIAQPDGKLKTGFEYDSIQFLTDEIALLFIGTNKFVMFRENELIDFSKFQQIQVLTNIHALPTDKKHEAIQLLLVSSPKGKGIYDMSGIQLLPPQYERISLVGDSLLVITHQKKTGLMSIYGEWLLPISYDGVGNLSGQGINILKAGKFGFFKTTQRKLIAPQYDASLRLFDDSKNYYMAVKKGKYGLIDLNNKVIVPFEYNNFLQWSSDSILVKKENDWYFFNYQTKKVGTQKYEYAEIIADENQEEERYVLLNDGKYWGLIHSKNGVVVPFSYKKIIPIENENKVFWGALQELPSVAEQEEKIELHYYDAKGKLFFSFQTNEDELEKIICEE